MFSLYVRNSIDCNDNDPKVYWPKTYYRDADGDGLGDPNNKLDVCSSTPPAGYVINNKDTNDNSPNVLSVQPSIATMKAFPHKIFLSAAPNPFSGTITIHYTVPVDAQVTITIFDLNGKEVAQVFSGEKKAGSYSTEYNTGKLAQGTYYCRMIATAKGEVFTQTQKLVKTN
jgi:hypothetical protein